MPSAFFQRELSSLDPLVPLIPQMSPPNPGRIPKDAKRLIFLRVGADAQDVSVEIFDLHLERPLEVLRRIPDSCARRDIPIVQGADILHADPYPHMRLALVVTGQKDGAPIARNAGKSVATTPSQLEAERVHVV